MSDIDFQPQDDGILMPIRARPGARRDGIDGIHAGALKISVTQAAEKGKANKAIIALLARELGLPKSAFTLRSGHTSSRKRVLVQGVTLRQLSENVMRIIGSDG